MVKIIDPVMYVFSKHTWLDSHLHFPELNGEKEKHVPNLDMASKHTFFHNSLIYTYQVFCKQENYKLLLFGSLL